MLSALFSSIGPLSREYRQNAGLKSGVVDLVANGWVVANAKGTTPQKAGVGMDQYTEILRNSTGCC